MTDAINTIRNGVIRSVSILEHSSTFPCALGATISCIPASEVTDIGEKYAYTVLPKSYINTPQVVYKYDATLQVKTCLFRALHQKNVAAHPRSTAMAG